MRMKGKDDPQKRKLWDVQTIKWLTYLKKNPEPDVNHENI